QYDTLDFEPTPPFPLLKRIEPPIIVDKRRLAEIVARMPLPATPRERRAVRHMDSLILEARPRRRSRARAFVVATLAAALAVAVSSAFVPNVRAHVDPRALIGGLEARIR